MNCLSKSSLHFLSEQCVILGQGTEGEQKKYCGQITKNKINANIHVCVDRSNSYHHTYKIQTTHFSKTFDIASIQIENDDRQLCVSGLTKFARTIGRFESKN